MGAVFGLFAGFYYWAPKIVGKTYNELLGNIHFFTLFIGVKKIKFLLFYFKFIKSSPKLIFNKSNGRTNSEEKNFGISLPALIDNDSIDIDDNTLDLKFNNLPTSPLPTPPLPEVDENKKHIIAKLKNIQSEAKFLDIKESKTDIFLKIKNKAGIYMFFNLVNGNTYIGSSVKLDRRFRAHISSIGKVKYPLYKALNKYGINNFAFLVLQFCEPNEDICLGLEQIYLDLHKPDYNILTLAGSSQGFKHSPGTIAKLKKKSCWKITS